LWSAFQAKRAGLYQTDLRVNRTTGAGCALTRFAMIGGAAASPSLAEAGKTELDIAATRTATPANAFARNRWVMKAPIVFGLVGSAGRAINWLDTS